MTDTPVSWTLSTVAMPGVPDFRSWTVVFLEPPTSKPSSIGTRTAAKKTPTEREAETVAVTGGWQTRHEGAEPDGSEQTRKDEPAVAVQSVLRTTP